MQLDEFAQDRKIDQMQLDVECRKQADAYFRWARLAVEAKSTSDRLEMVMELIEAQLQADVRKKPSKYKVEEGPRGGLTEAAVKAAVYSQPTYVTARDNFLNAKEEAAILAKAENAMEHKKRMLELLVTLHGQSYFADPKMGKRHLENYDRAGQLSGAARTFQKSKLRKAKGE